jgi:hypothetical protein
MPLTDLIARVCHEANSAYCRAVGDPSLPHWDDLEESYRQSTRQGVEAALAGATSEALHESWLVERKAQGWVVGPVLDRAAKIHPNLIPYDCLPPAQQRKDALFAAIVASLQ